jgi:hypothetical protein
LVFTDGWGLPMAWPSAKIGFAYGLSLPMAGPLPMALLCHRHSMWFVDGLFPGHRQTLRPSANKPFPVVHVTVVPRVEVPVKEPVGVQGSVPSVLPQVEPDHGHCDLAG